MARAERITVIGGGGWGIALANLLAAEGPVTLWEFFPYAMEMLRDQRCRPEVLPDIQLDDNILVTGDPREAMEQSELALFVVPSHALRNAARSFAPYIPAGLPIASATKGLETDSLKRMSIVLGEELNGDHPIVVLSGPSHAEEVSREMPTTLVAASADAALATRLQDWLMRPYLRVYTCSDVVGVELGGSLKNIIAIAAGMCSALGYGDNAMGAIITRGLAEITRLGVAFGARPTTFMGLSGLGDLITTCISSNSRNRRLGERIGQGDSLDDILSGSAMVVEGIYTVKAAYQLSEQMGVDMPIAVAVYEVLYGGMQPALAARELMTRQPRAEDGG
jgi:glycerol-3-phosphate dehydrogenase (NAD(P)+)